jgi:hypothetical protein
MPQEDYDQGYEDGKRARDSEVASLQQALEWARGDLEKERSEAKRLRDIVHRPRVLIDPDPF